MGDEAKEFVGSGERRSVETLGAREIEVGFVDANHFYDGRKGGEDGGDAVAPFGVLVMMAIEKNAVGAELACSAEGHRGLHAKLARFVAGGGDDATLIGAATHDHREAAKLGPFQEFDGNEEGVHIDVEDGGVGREGERFGGIVNGAEASQIRHAKQGTPKRASEQQAKTGGLHAFGGEDAMNAGEIFGDAYVGPVRGIEQGLNGRKTVVAELENEDAGGRENAGGLKDELAVEFVAFFSAVESGGGLVVADFGREFVGFTEADVGRIADDELEEF